MLGKLLIFNLISYNTVCNTNTTTNANEIKALTRIESEKKFTEGYINYVQLKLTFCPGLWIRINFLRIWIQQFFSMQIRFQLLFKYWSGSSLKTLCKKLPYVEFSVVKKHKRFLKSKKNKGACANLPGKFE